MMPPLADVYRLAPVFIACGFGVLIMLADAFIPSGSRGALARVGVVGALASLAAVGIAARHTGSAFSGLLHIDAFSLFFEAAIFSITVLVMLGSYDYLEREGLPMGEYHALLLFAACGMSVMASAENVCSSANSSPKMSPGR